MTGVQTCALPICGTSALHLSLVQTGVKPGDVVLVPPLTFIAAVNPVRYMYAKPVFIDCDDSFCIDPIKLRAFCEEECEFVDEVLKYKGACVKAIVVVHVFGNMADMESIIEIASEYNLTVIEDATEALGTYYTEGKYAGKYAGTIGDFGAYSFNGNKIITTGGGGAVTANKGEIVEHIKYLSTQAKNDPHYYIHDEIGYNYRMTNLQAALGVAQMEELPEFINRKNSNYETYREYFNDYKLARLMPFRAGIKSNKWFYSLLIDRSKINVSMREIITTLKNNYNIETRAIWGLINEQVPYQREDTYLLEKAPYYATRIINIPSSTQITKEDIEYVSNSIMEYFDSLAK